MQQPSPTRRRFLQASAALACPLILPRLHAGESPNDKLTLGAIGVGGRGTEIARQAASLGQMVAVCDVHKDNAVNFQQMVKEKFQQDCKVYTDFREMLAQESDIDAVTIGTPDHWHVRNAIEAMKSGKHVYCEKPLTLTLGEGKAIQDAVARYGKVFQVGTQQRSEFGMNFLKAVAIAHSGRLGDKLHARSSVGRGGSRSPIPDMPFGPFPTATVPEALDWDLWQGPAGDVDFCPQRVGWNFRWWFEYSGGQVTDWGVHHTDIAFWALAGEDGQAIGAEGTAEFMGVDREEVLQFLLGERPAREMPHAYNTALAFDVNIGLSTGNEIQLVSEENALLISGERGRIRVNRGGLTGKPVEEIDADPKAKQEIEERMAKLYGGELPQPHLGHMQNFLDAIADGRQPIANVADHVRAVNACHLANVAILLDQAVEFDPEACEFRGNNEANRLVNRQAREEFPLLV
ncbi:MAG: Gfo/Idh/MocA family oxidoreductase [Planctomycetota bacterium]